MDPQSILKLLNLQIKLKQFKNVKKMGAMPKKCFSVARLLTEAKKAKYYVEGFYIAKEIGFPIGHAWIVDENDQAIDFAIRDEGEHQEDVYLGVEITQEEFNENMINPEFIRHFEKHDLFPFTRAKKQLIAKNQP